MEAKAVLAPRQRVAGAGLLVDAHRPSVQERCSQQQRLGNRRADLVQRPDLEAIAVGKVIHTVVMVKMGVAEHYHLDRPEVFLRPQLGDLIGAALVPGVDHEASVVPGHQDVGVAGQQRCSQTRDHGLEPLDSACSLTRNLYFGALPRRSLV